MKPPYSPTYVDLTTPPTPAILATRLHDQGWSVPPEVLTLAEDWPHLSSNAADPLTLAAHGWHALRWIGLGFRPTPLLRSTWLSALAGTDVYLKLESEQVTGAFKARGAAHKVLSPQAMGSVPRNRSVVTASTGNHAMAVLNAAACARRWAPSSSSSPSPSPSSPASIDPDQDPAPVVVFVPTTVSAAKANRLEALGAQLHRVGEQCIETEGAARAYAADHQLPFVSPYNDPFVAGGHGTLAVEVLAAIPKRNTAIPQPRATSSHATTPPSPPPPLSVFIPVGGGGLVAGVASMLKTCAGMEVHVHGCEPSASDALQRGIEAGRVLRQGEWPETPTLSDATAGGLEEGSITFTVARDLVDTWHSIPEPEIAAAVRGVLDHEGKCVEGAAAVAVASALRVFATGRYRDTNATVVIVCCGGNTSSKHLQTVLDLTAGA